MKVSGNGIFLLASKTFSSHPSHSSGIMVINNMPMTPMTSVFLMEGIFANNSWTEVGHRNIVVAGLIQEDTYLWGFPSEAVKQGGKYK